MAEAYWVADEILSFHLEIAEVTSQKERYAFIEFVHVMEPIDKVDTALKYHCLRWTTENKINHTLNVNHTSSTNVDIGGCYGLVRFAFMSCVHHIFAPILLAAILPAEVINHLATVR